MTRSLTAARAAHRVAASLTAVFAIALSATDAGAAETTPPSDASAGRPPQEIVAELMTDQKALNDQLGKGNAVLKTKASRDAHAPALLPLAMRMHADLKALAVAEPQMQEQIDGSQIQLVSLLSALGDPSAAGEIAALVNSKDPARVAEGRAHQLMSTFYITENADAPQSALVADVEKADRQYPDSVPLAQTSIEIAHEQIVPGLGDGLLELVATEMHNSTAAELAEKLTAKKEAADADAKVANKPITISGTLPTGQPFSTASLKGKVILIDFWATWCGPCKAELPRVKKVYADFHAKGLEVVGVSNDYDVTSLTSFVLNEQMPWPELFDPKAAADQEWNPITVQQKINGIPVMYLIDKRGILRTANARDNMEELIPQLLAEAP